MKKILLTLLMCISTACSFTSGEKGTEQETVGGKDILQTAEVRQAADAAEEDGEHAELKRRCAGNDAFSCGELAELYQLDDDEKGQKTDDKQAAHYAEKACSLSDEQCGKLASMYYYGQGNVIRQDYRQAAHYAQKACEPEAPADPEDAFLGDPDACAILVVLYHTGEGVQQNGAKSDYYSEKVIEIGGFDHRNWIGREMTERGQNSVINNYERECREGDADACEELAWFYEYGRGVLPDTEQAAQYYQKACRLRGKKDCG